VEEQQNLAEQQAKQLTAAENYVEFQKTDSGRDGLNNRSYYPVSNRLVCFFNIYLYIYMCVCMCVR
jgi:hypothetical protein